MVAELPDPVLAAFSVGQPQEQLLPVSHFFGCFAFEFLLKVK